MSETITTAPVDGLASLATPPPAVSEPPGRIDYVAQAIESALIAGRKGGRADGRATAS